MPCYFLMTTNNVTIVERMLVHQATPSQVGMHATTGSVVQMTVAQWKENVAPATPPRRGGSEQAQEVQSSSTCFPLDQWARLFHVWKQLKKLKLFDQDRRLLWRSFCAWRQRTTAAKFLKRVAALESALIYLQPKFRETMVALRFEVEKLLKVQLVHIPDYLERRHMCPPQPFTIRELIELQGSMCRKGLLDIQATYMSMIRVLLTLNETIVYTVESRSPYDVPHHLHEHIQSWYFGPVEKFHKPSLQQEKRLQHRVQVDRSGDIIYKVKTVLKGEGTKKAKNGKCTSTVSSGSLAEMPEMELQPNSMSRAKARLKTITEEWTTAKAQLQLVASFFRLVDMYVVNAHLRLAQSAVAKFDAQFRAICKALKLNVDVEGEDSKLAVSVMTEMNDLVTQCFKKFPRISEDGGIQEACSDCARLVRKHTRAC
jgi:hypothetical protein